MCWQSHWTRLSLLRVKSFFSKRNPPTSIKLEETPGERIDLRIWGQSAVPYTPDDMHFLFPTWQKVLNSTKKWRWLSIWSRSDLVLWDQSVKGILSNRHSKNVNRMKRCTQIPTPTLAFSAFSLSDTSWRTAHTLSTVIVQARIVKIIPSSHHCWLALPEFDGNCIHDLTILWLFSLSLTFFCVSTPRCLAEWLFQSPMQVMSPTVRLIWSEGFFRHLVAATLVKVLHLIILVSLSQAKGNLMRNVPSLHPIPSQTGVNYRIRVHTLKFHQQFTYLKKLLNWLHNEHEKLWMIGAKLVGVNFSLPHNDSVQMQVRQLEHEADARFSQRPRELFSRFSQEAHQALEDQREILGNGSDIRSMDTIYVQTSVFKHYTSEDSTQQQSQEHVGPHQHLTGLFGAHSHIEKCLKNLELLIQPLDQKLIEFDEEKKNSCVKYEVTKMTGQYFEAPLLLFWNRTDLESDKIQDIRRPAVRSRVMQRNYAIARISHRISQEILRQKLKAKRPRFKVFKEI